MWGVSAPIGLAKNSPQKPHTRGWVLSTSQTWLPFGITSSEGREFDKSDCTTWNDRSGQSQVKPRTGLFYWLGSFLFWNRCDIRKASDQLLSTFVVCTLFVFGGIVLVWNCCRFAVGGPPPPSTTSCKRLLSSRKKHPRYTFSVGGEQTKERPWVSRDS